ncbi:MAG: hypothetical protein Q4G43_05925 [Mobilicoccus sp.]|nr:hypothetical protein [Mobilicoccus sp.]
MNSLRRSTATGSHLGSDCATTTDGSTTLAPAYDMVPMAHRPGVDGRLSMAVAGECRLAAIAVDHLEREVLAWGGDASVVRTTVEGVAQAVEE